jgi:hypothetical protein
VVPITPARPKAPKPKAQPAKSKPKTPAAPFTFASRQIEASRNKRSAAVLFTPYKHHAGVGHSVNEPQPSPTLQPAAQLATCPAQNVVPQLGSEDLSDDNVEEQLQEGLHRLNFGSGSDSQFHAGSRSHSGSQSFLSSQSSSSSQSRSISPSHSGPQAPHAGPHSKLKKAAVKPRAGAKDVWTFFTEVKRRRVCVLCQ